MWKLLQEKIDNVKDQYALGETPCGSLNETKVVQIKLWKLLGGALKKPKDKPNQPDKEFDGIIYALKNNRDGCCALLEQASIVFTGEYNRKCLIISFAVRDIRLYVYAEGSQLDSALLSPSSATTANPHKKTKKKKKKATNFSSFHDQASFQKQKERAVDVAGKDSADENTTNPLLGNDYPGQAVLLPSTTTTTAAASPPPPH
jgi:hypothetical protein